MFKTVLKPRETADPRLRIKADRRVDDAWRSFAAWLGAMVGMSDEGAPPDLPSLRTLNILLFGDGLTFIITPS